jgi:hypothetical protein
MSLTPLLDASAAIQVHAFAALAALAIGAAQLAAPKGTLPHRAVGWSWVTLMTIVAVLDSRTARLGSVEPDPSALDLHAGRTAARGDACARPPHRSAPQRHDRDLHRRAGRRRPFHLAARPHHARGGVSAVGLGLVPAKAEAITGASRWQTAYGSRVARRKPLAGDDRRVLTT